MNKVKAIRVVVYEGGKDWVDKTLSNSLPIGTTQIGENNITCALVVYQEETDFASKPESFINILNEPLNSNNS